MTNAVGIYPGSETDLKQNDETDTTKAVWLGMNNTVTLHSLVSDCLCSGTQHCPQHKTVLDCFTMTLCLDAQTGRKLSIRESRSSPRKPCLKGRQRQADGSDGVLYF